MVTILINFQQKFALVKSFQHFAIKFLNQKDFSHASGFSFKLARKMWRFFTRTAIRNRLKQVSEKEWRNGFRKALHTRAKMASYV